MPFIRSTYPFTSQVSIAWKFPKIESWSRIQLKTTIQPTFLRSGILGENICEIWEITSWIRSWFFILFLAFMILPNYNRPPYDTYLPHDGRLDDILPIVIDLLHYLPWFYHCFLLDWKVKVDRKRSLRDVVGIFLSGKEHPLGVDYSPASRPSPDGADSAPDASAFGSPFEFHKANLK